MRGSSAAAWSDAATLLAAGVGAVYCCCSLGRLLDVSGPKSPCTHSTHHQDTPRRQAHATKGRDFHAGVLGGSHTWAGRSSASTTWRQSAHCPHLAVDAPTSPSPLQSPLWSNVPCHVRASKSNQGQPRRPTYQSSRSSKKKSLHPAACGLVPGECVRSMSWFWPC